MFLRSRASLLQFTRFLRSWSSSSKPLWGAPVTTANNSSPSIELTVNGQAVKVPPGTSIMQAAALVGVDVPRFCYHERLKIAGNCRMCLVQVNGGPKLMASCAAPAAPKMIVETESQAVKKAREGVMEFLLANHPLDCPICDQGGECDLQEQAMAFGSDRSRFRINVEDKRSVEDKQFGPLIKTSMNRCIHCTRCVRFANDVAGVDDLGTTGRGNDMQISTYIEKTLDSELSGNVIDLCPVGALTSKPYAFMARPWELRKTESIDVMDAVGANIRIDSRGMEVMRILPRLHEQINEEWLGDKSRFACDGLRRQRLTIPLIRQGDHDSMLVEANWEQALLTAATRIRECKPEEMAFVMGQFTDLETTLLMKDFSEQLNCKNLLFDGASLNAAPLPTSTPALYRFGGGISKIEESDAILLIGTNPRKEAPLINARIRKAYLKNPNLRIGLLGELSERGLTYEVEQLGLTTNDIGRLMKSDFWSHFKASKTPSIIIGQSVYELNAFKAIYELIKDCGRSLLRPDWNGYHFLPQSMSRTGALRLGWTGSKSSLKDAKLIYLLGADDIRPEDIASDAFVIYQGHHGDMGAQIADLVLPGCAYSEKDASWMNMEGRIQRGRAAVPGPGEARPDWQIVRALAEVTGIDLGYDDLGSVQGQLRRILGPYDALPQDSSHLKIPAVLESLSETPYDPKAILKSAIKDYYLTDCISRASPTMSLCSQQFTKY